MRLNEVLLLKDAKLEGNVLKNVHILGFESANGYKYSKEAVKKATPKYEGAPSYLNHAQRTVENKFAVIKNPVFKEESGIWGDYVINEAHPAFAQVKWWAQNESSQIGLSHSISGEMNDKKTEVTAIDSVESVDLVHKPATVAGLYEMIAEPNIQLDRLVEGLYSTYRASNLDLQIVIDSTKKFLEVIKKEKLVELEDVTLEMLHKDRKDLVEAIARPAADAAAKLEQKINEALSKLPEASRSAIFVEQIRACNGDEAKMKALVDDRLALSAAPKSAGKPVVTESDDDADADTDDDDSEVEADDIDEDKIEESVLKVLKISKGK